MNEDNEIQPYHEALYIESLLTQTKAIVFEKECLIKYLDDYHEGKKIEIELILDCLQNIIVKAADISKYFWPTKPFVEKGKTSNKVERNELYKRYENLHESRAEKLRKAFGIKSKNNPIANRDMRNMIEHFDSKLDVYLNDNNVTGTIMPYYLGIHVEEINSYTHYFRAFFSSRYIFRILNVDFEILPILNETIRIHNLLIDFKNDGGRLK
ncbi:hypothetical protein IMCC3317_46640 [Kordia antarctica]|uniref:Uncharacterized protein n=1 Tax=Kordia antarctica TaxID=1218801 RepID=A0A7L4ZS61_9FLAO|nr:hypothetical protein [Kordia antarctica]QHI39259.1 hypothetical protein IMCC3317_46640 [Kordia antarctica]